MTSLLVPPAPHPSSHLYPLSIVWTPIPLLSYIFPFIGHIGVCRLNGDIYDFSGPYQITRGYMLFGWPTRYVPLEVRVDSDAGLEKVLEGYTQNAPSRRELASQYDTTLDGVTNYYEQRMMYNFFLRNCHHFCCDVLNEFEKGLNHGFDKERCNKVLVNGEVRDVDDLEPFELQRAQEMHESDGLLERRRTPKVTLALHGVENDWMFRLVKSLSQVVFGKDTWWNIAALAWLAWWYGRYVSTGRMIYTVLPVAVTWVFLLGWLWLMARAFVI